MRAKPWFLRSAPAQILLPANGRYRARPLDIIQLRLHRFILPFKSKARSRRMMSGHTTGCRIIRIIIADDQSVYRHIHLSAFYFLRPPLNRLRKSAGIRCFPVHNIKSLFFQNCIRAPQERISSSRCTSVNA